VLAIASERQSGISLFLFWRRRYDLKKTVSTLKLREFIEKKLFSNSSPKYLLFLCHP
jgi:hypothetical protein